MLSILYFVVNERYSILYLILNYIHKYIVLQHIDIDNFKLLYLSNYSIIDKYISLLTYDCYFKLDHFILQP